MPILRRLYSEAYDRACTVDEDTESLVLEAYNHDQISWEEAQRLWCEIVEQTANPAGKSRSAQ